MIDLSKELLLDGAMGSLLMERANAPIGHRLERLNIENPDIVKSVHNDYLNAGSNIIFTNTFGLNCYNFDNIQLEKLSTSAISIAKNCVEGKDAFVALDIGPLGKIIGDGGIDFDEAYNAYKQIITLANDKTDIIVIETMTCLTEAKIATLAALENSKLPVMVSMSFEENGISVFGNPIECFAKVIGSMGIDAIGINCTLGPKEMLKLIKRLKENTDKPVFIKPNAGMPTVENGKTVYHTTKNEFATFTAQAKKMGVKIVGGCCGTTPKFIAETKKEWTKVVAGNTKYRKRSIVCSAYKYVEIDAPKIVGERINPTGKKAFQKALIEEDWGYILAQAIEQEVAKADILDVNVGLNGIDEEYTLAKLVKKLQGITTLPLQIDTTDIKALEKALRVYTGKAIINSVNGTKESLDTVLPLAKKYGAAVIGLTIDEKGVSNDINERVNIAKKIIEKCQEIGIDKEDIYIDTLTMAEASGKGNALCTLGALKDIKKLGVKTALGISNISFGMPSRMDINAMFMELAIDAGLDLCIINPNLIGIKGSKFAKDFLLAKDGATEKYIEYATSQVIKQPKAQLSYKKTLFDAVYSGQKELAKSLCSELLKENEPLSIVSKYLIPALDKVGEDYQSKKLFLPQLIASAQAAKEAFSKLEKVMVNEQVQQKKVFVIATIKGDVHDIGKNIVKAVVANYGYKVIDLGKDVDYDEILKAVKKYYPCVLGLSALMTTTAVNIQKAIKIVKEKHDIPILVGGAVITKEYATKIGGIYCKDANDAVKTLKALP